MQPLKKFLEASFRFKVLVPVVLVMAVILAGAMFVVNLQFRQYVEENALNEFKLANVRLKDNLVRFQNSQRGRFQTLARVPMYRAAFESKNTETIRVSLTQMYHEEQLASERIEFMFYTPVKSATTANAERMLVQQRSDLAPATIFDHAALVTRLATNGAAANDTILLDEQLFMLVALPIYNLDGDRLGALTLGQKMDEMVFQQLNFGTRGETAFLGEDFVVIHTFKDSEMTPQISCKLGELFKHLDRQPNVESNRLVIAEGNYFYTGGQLPSLKGDRSLGYLLFSSYDQQIHWLQTTQQLLLATIIILIFIGAAFVLFFINRATAPLRQLHAAAEAVGRGDFSARVNIHSKDEFGELGHAFNQMTENIELSQSKLKQTVETLKTTQAQLIQSEKLSAVGEFVAGVAHELNNPLAAVMGFSEMLKNADVGEKHSRHLNLIFKSAERCQKIVQSLLSFARRSAPERKPVGVNKLIEDVLEMIAYPLRTSNVKVVTQFAHKLPVVLADGHQVQQVVLNVINNARQALEGYTEAACITLTTNHDANFVRIVIQDNGPGIQPENLKRIFDPFFTTKEVGKGTGLGLSLCYGMIREHGGNILVTSQLGTGTTFTIELPIAAETAWFETAFLNQGLASAKPEVNEGAGKKILVVDDEESLLQMIKEELTSHSYEVVTVANGESALREVSQQKFDAIVCDLKMPGLNGRQVYERLRVENPAASRRMVFVTGDIIGDPLRNFLETEKRPCLNKPFTLGDLRQAVKDMLVRN